MNKTEKEEVETDRQKTESNIGGSQHSESTRVFLLAIDLRLNLDIIHHRASLKLLQLNEGQTLCHINICSCWPS